MSNHVAAGPDAPNTS